MPIHRPASPVDLIRPATAAPDLASPPAIEIGGDWELRIDLLQGSRVHRLNLEQCGAALAGQQRLPHFAGPVSGWLSGNLIQLSFASRYEGSTICYFFDGEVGDGRMRGTAVLGVASDQNHGILSRSQFGTGQWQASRISQT